MLRVAVAPAQSGAGADRPSARSGGFELGDVEPTGPEPRRLGPEAVVAPRIWTEAEAAAEDEEPLPRPDKSEKIAAAVDAEPKPETAQAQPAEEGQKDKTAPDADAASSDEDAERPELQDAPDTSADPAKSTETESAETGLLKTDPSEDDAEDRKAGMDPAAVSAAEASDKAPEHTSDTEASSATDQPEPFGPEEADPVPRTPEMIARDVWLRGYLTERGRDA